MKCQNNNATSGQTSLQIINKMLVDITPNIY